MVCLSVRDIGLDGETKRMGIQVVGELTPGDIKRLVEAFPGKWVTLPEEGDRTLTLKYSERITLQIAGESLNIYFKGSFRPEDIDQVLDDIREIGEVLVKLGLKGKIKRVNVVGSGNPWKVATEALLAITMDLCLVRRSSTNICSECDVKQDCDRIYELLNRLLNARSPLHDCVF